MTVYLGSQGTIELQRTSGDPVFAELAPDDVSVDARRFSFSDREIYGEFINGDQVDIDRVGDDGKPNGKNLDLIAGHDFPDWRGFIYVNPLGGMRLYERFEDAITGTADNALELVEPSSTQRLKLKTRNSNFSHLAQIRGYELTTERETVDITQLGEQFRQQYEAGLISGQGSIDCFWDFQAGVCDPDGCCDPGAEFPNYLAQLCVRLTQGADFIGRYFVYRPDTPDIADYRYVRTSVWYEAECIVTNATVTVEAGGLIESRIDFVTTKQIKLLTGLPPSFLLLETGTEKVLQEDSVSNIGIIESDIK